jgi:hypothetical protein
MEAEEPAANPLHLDFASVQQALEEMPVRSRPGGFL